MSNPLPPKKIKQRRRNKSKRKILKKAKRCGHDITLFLVFFLKTLDNRENDFSRFICLSPCRLDLFPSAPSVSPFSEKENFPTYQPCLRLRPPMSQWRWQFPLILLLPFLPLFSFFSVYRRVNISCELFLFLFPPSVRSVAAEQNKHAQKKSDSSNFSFH